MSLIFELNLIVLQNYPTNNTSAGRRVICSGNSYISTILTVEFILLALPILVESIPMFLLNMKELYSDPTCNPPLYRQSWDKYNKNLEIWGFSKKQMIYQGCNSVYS